MSLLGCPGAVSRVRNKKWHGESFQARAETFFVRSLTAPGLVSGSDHPYRRPINGEFNPFFRVDRKRRPKT